MNHAFLRYPHLSKSPMPICVQIYIPLGEIVWSTAPVTTIQSIFTELGCLRFVHNHGKSNTSADPPELNWLVVSTPLKNISQLG